MYLPPESIIQAQLSNSIDPLVVLYSLHLYIMLVLYIMIFTINMSA